MRAIALLIIGCLPLGTLTVWSFVELGSIDDDVAAGPSLDVLRGAAAGTLRTGNAARSESRVAQRLAGADFFAGQSVSARANLPEESPLHGVVEAWTRWTEARQMVATYLEGQRQADSDDLAELTAVRDRLAAIREEYERTTLRGRRLFLILLRERTRAVERRIRVLKRRAEAAAIISRAREAFRSQEYSECVTLCDGCLAQYTADLDPAVVADVKVLRGRAEFWADGMQLNQALKATGDPAGRRDLTDAFLKKHGSLAGRTAAEERVLQWVREQLKRAEATLARQARQKEAGEQIQDLMANLPEDFQERVRRAARIARDYADVDAGSPIRASVLGWMKENLPAKPLDEHELLQEAERADGRLLRGFFKENVGPDGQLIGYEFYRTYEQYVDPKSAVGTIRTSQLRGRPAASLPRRAVEAYSQARDRLLAEPARPEAWSELADTCQALENQLEVYQQKPGSSRQGLSFAAEARFARNVLQGTTLDDLKTLFPR